MNEDMTEDSLARLQAGDGKAFEAIYSRFRAVIHAYAVRLLRDGVLAEDVTHDTLLKARMEAGSLRDHRAFRQWLFTIARNEIYRRFRRNRQFTDIEDEEPIDDATPLNIVESMDTAAIVQQMISSLKPEYREVIVLREYDHFSYAEIAEITGSTVQAVKSRLWKARRALVEKVKPYFNEV